MLLLLLLLLLLLPLPSLCGGEEIICRVLYNLCWHKGEAALLHQLPTAHLLPGPYCQHAG